MCLSIATQFHSWTTLLTLRAPEPACQPLSASREQLIAIAAVHPTKGCVDPVHQVSMSHEHHSSDGYTLADLLSQVRRQEPGVKRFALEQTSTSALAPTQDGSVGALASG